MKQVNNAIRKLFHGLSVEKMYVTQDLFWTEYTLFDNKNGSFDGDEFIWKSKYIRGGNSHLWHQKYLLTCTKVIGFIACRVTRKVIYNGAVERYWGDANTMKYGKIPSIRSDVS